MSDAQVAEVDAFIAGYKAFDGFMPPWLPVVGRGRDWQVRWPIVNIDGASSGLVCFETDAAFTEISLSVIFRRNPIYRLDLVPPDAREGNPFHVQKYAPHLPAQFKGPHTHSWEDNKAWVRDQGLGELPFRCPLGNPPPDLERAFEFVVQEVNLTVLPSQRGIELPPQSGLILRGGGKR